MRPDIHTLTGPYVLDAIEPEERAEFESHLAECESCRTEVEALRHTAAALADSSATTPPAGLRQRVLSAAEQTPQLPPLTTRRADPRRRWIPRLLVAAAAVAVIATGVSVTDDEKPSINATSVFASADARTRDIAVSGGQVRVGISKRLGLVAVDASALPALSDQRVYQVWLVTDSGPKSLAVLDRETSTTAKIPAAGDLAITAEPEGGSAAPTSEPLFTVDPADL